MRRHIAIGGIAACLVAGIAFVGGGESRVPADFRFISRASIHTLDPARMSYIQDIQAATALWEGLTRLDPKTCEPVEGVAYLPPRISDDGLTLVFTLRPEARWSNGDPVTAADFVRGWRRAIEPGTADVYAELIADHIAGAAEYAAWRTAHVNLLSVIRLLQKGSPIKGELLAQVLKDPAGAILTERLARPLPTPLPANQDPYWNECAVELSRVDADWKSLGDRILDAHLAEMESRFARVGMRALDDHHLEVRLARPTPYFLDLTAFATYLPIHESIEILRERYEGRLLSEAGVWACDPQWTKPDYHKDGYPGVVTNGPYRLVDWRFKRRLRFEANPYYWDQEHVRSRTIEAIDIEYRSTAFMLYEQGLVDMMMDLTMDYTPELLRQVHLGLRDDIHASPSFGTYYLTLNCRPRLNDGRPNPLADARVRRALAQAINRQELVEHVRRLGNPISRTFIPRGQIPGYRSPEGLAYDPEEARRLLAEAGYPGGRGLPVIEYLYNTGANNEPIAQAVERMWERQLGIHVQLVAKETKAFADDLTEHRFMTARSGWFGDYMDPTTFLDLLHSANGHNTSGFADPHYDGLLAEAARTTDAARRLAILAEAERYLIEEQVPVVPLFTYVMVNAWRSDVVGVYSNPRNWIPLHCLGKVSRVVGRSAGSS